MLGDKSKVPQNVDKRKTIIIRSNQINEENLANALYNLTNNKGLIIWLYIRLYQKSGSLLSCNDIREKTGISLKMYTEGVDELINKGYLNWVESNTWEFSSNGEIH